jgi:light-regulated signal transduction histidine kinase (bacteriophytochrome)
MQRDELERLSKDELIDLLLAQHEQLAKLQAAFEQLKADYEALLYKFEHNQRKPPPTSKNSSLNPLLGIRKAVAQASWQAAQARTA